MGQSRGVSPHFFRPDSLEKRSEPDWPTVLTPTPAATGWFRKASWFLTHLSHLRANGPSC